MDRLPEFLITKIQKASGITLSGDLMPAIVEHVEKRLSELNLSMESYSLRLEADSHEMELLINATTVNETYFFRDEHQYDFLHDSFFPGRSRDQLRIWCGACSTGEEPLSIYAMAKNMDLNVEITATDINTEALAFFRKGIYSKKSFREDGKKYHRLIQKISSANETSIEVNLEDIRKIHISSINLNRDTPLPFVMNCFDLILLRNILIYFPEEVILKILSQLWAIIKPDGMLLLSTNEIASIPNNDYFEKKRKGSIYYLQKKSLKKAAPIKNLADGLKIGQASANKTAAAEKNVVTEEQIASASGKTRECLMDSYQEVKRYIDRQNFRKAEELLSKITFPVTELEFKYFLEGLINYQQKKHQESEIFFYKSASLNQDFWPATVMLGFTYKIIGKNDRALASFTQSLNILTEYLKSGKTCYNFTIDFDPVYLISLCRNNIDEVRKLIGE